MKRFILMVLLYLHVTLSFPNDPSNDLKSLMKNFFLPQGLTHNLGLLSESVDAFYQSLAGTRCANTIECEQKRIKKGLSKGHKEKITKEMVEQWEVEQKQVMEGIKMKEAEKKKAQLEGIDGRRHLTTVAEQYFDTNGYVDGEYRVQYSTACDSEGTVTNVTTESIYTCNGIKVTQQGYNVYNGQPGYTCTITPITLRKGCWCRLNEAGGNCQPNFFTACNITIIDPDFSKPCKDYTHDSPFYSFSNPGYDPCNFVQLNQSITLTYRLKCFQEEPSEMLDYWQIAYDSITTAANTNFSTILTDPSESVRLDEQNENTIVFSLQNWNWLSKTTDFLHKITTLDQLYGAENLTTTIDFTKIPEGEEKYYTPGGRIFMEPQFQTSMQRMASYGFFFDIEGYKEPTRTVDIWFVLITIFISFIFAGIVGLVIYCYAKRWYKRKQLLKEAEKDDIIST